MPLRPQNLATLEFDTHLFMREGARAISTLEVPAHEVKNRTELAFDIPPRVAKMLIEYRDRFAPKIIGHRPTRLFVNVDGTPKNQATCGGSDHDLSAKTCRDRAHAASVSALEREGRARSRPGRIRDRQTVSRPQEHQDHGRGLCRHRQPPGSASASVSRRASPCH